MITLPVNPTPASIAEWHHPYPFYYGGFLDGIKPVENIPLRDSYMETDRGLGE